MVWSVIRRVGAMSRAGQPQSVPVSMMPWVLRTPNNHSLNVELHHNSVP